MSDYSAQKSSLQINKPSSVSSKEEAIRKTNAGVQSLADTLSENTQDVLFSATVSAGQLVNLYTNAGVLNAKVADSSIANTYADGFVESAVTSGSTGTVRLLGRNIFLSALTPGATYYLSTAGAISTTPGANSQIVGKALSTTELWFNPERK